MDPLSPSASAVALLGAIIAVTKSLFKLIKSVKNAPQDLVSVSTEIEDLFVVLALAEMAFQGPSVFESNVELSNVVSTVFRRMEDKLLELKQLVSSFCDISEGETTSFKSLEWAVRGKEKARRIRDEIAALKWPISTCLGSLSFSSNRQNGQTLSRLGLDVQSLERNFQQAAQSFEIHQRSINLVIEDVRQSQNTMYKRIETKVDEIGAQAAEHGLNMFVSGQLHSLLPPTAAAVHLSKHQQTITPQIFDGLIGSVLLGYTGVPLVARCQFPVWLLPYVVTVAAYCRYGKPAAGLSVARVRPHSSQVFAFAESGNVTGLKYIFDHGLASPCDISAQTGDQPLHIAADHGLVDTCRLLIAYGADPHQTDIDQQNTPHSFAWALILSNIVSRQQRRQMEILFPNVYASFEFPRLHQLTLQLESGSLEAEAESNSFDINIQDSDGNTALNWACARGDARTAQWLLTRGADPNMPNQNIGRTPLMAACSSVSLACIKMLLNFGAEVNIRNIYGLDALIYLCDEERDPQPITEMLEAARLLISHGIDLNPHGEYFAWCLSRAARTELVEIMELIVDQGVDINQRNPFDQTALLRAIAWTASRSVAFLLSRGAAHTGEAAADLDGRTLLHYAALSPDMKVIQVLIDSKLTGLDPDVTDKMGLTAEDYVNKADDLITGFLPAFLHLASDMRTRYHSQELPQPHSPPFEERCYESEDEFLDALQSL